MIRRLAALLLSLILLCAAAAAETVSGTETPEPAGGQNALTALSYDSLLDKFMRQLQISGLRGLFRLTVGGEGDLAASLAPLSGARLEFRALTLESENTAEIKAQLTRGDETVTNTKLWANGQSLYLRSDLLVDTDLRWPWKGDFVSSFTSAGTANPSLLEPTVRALLHGYDWKSIDSPLRQEVETWLMGFVQSPEQITENGAALIRVRYEIPAQAIRAEMKRLLRIALEDEGLREQIGFYMTDEQKAVAFSRSGLDYEDRVIDTLPLGDGIRIERVLSSRGGTYRENVEVGMPETGAGWTALMIRTEGQRQIFTLRSEERELSLDVTNSGALTWEGTLTDTQTGKPALAVAFRLEGTVQEGTDAEGLLHEMRTWTFSAQPAEGNEAAFEPVAGRAQLHFYSRRDKMSGTTVEVEVHCTVGAAQLDLNGKLATVDKWEIQPMTVTEYVDVPALSDDARQELLGDFATNLMLMLSLGEPAAEPETAETAEAPGEEETAGTPAEETPQDEEPQEETPAETEAPADEPAQEAQDDGGVDLIPFVEEEVDLDEEESE